MGWKKRMTSEEVRQHELYHRLRQAISEAWNAQTMVEVSEALRPIIEDSAFDRLGKEVS